MVININYGSEKVIPLFITGCGEKIYFESAVVSILIHYNIGGQQNAHQPIFPYNVIVSSSSSLAHNSAFIVSNNFNFGTEARCMVFQAPSKFGANSSQFT